MSPPKVPTPTETGYTAIAGGNRYSLALVPGLPAPAPAFAPEPSAADTAIATLLYSVGLLDSAVEEKLAGYLSTTLANWRGTPIGTVRAVLDG